MLHIDSGQFDRLRQRRLADFCRHLVRRARLRHPGVHVGLSDDALATCLEAEVERARSAGLRTRGQLERWADLACTLGFGFADRLPWAERVLATAQLPAQHLRALEEGAVFAVRRSPAPRSPQSVNTRPR